MTNTDPINLARLKALLNHIARRPTADDLWRLHGTLLVCTQDHPDAQLIHHVAREFYVYVSEIQSKMTARQYNELASRLDIASVGVLALQDILIERDHLRLSLLLGSIGEGLMVLASRQYVKAWEQELRSVHRNAAWMLYEIWWQLSRKHQPDMPTLERQVLIEATLARALDEEAPFESRMLLLLRLFQIALLLLAAPLCVATET
jgi:hypothetical protein